MADDRSCVNASVRCGAERTESGDPLSPAWLVNPHQADEPSEHAKTDLPTGRPEWSVLDCQLRSADSLVEGAMSAAGRSLPDMSLAFALMAAINGSTGSRATLSYGLFGTKPRRRQPGGSKILNAQGWRRKPPETLSCKSVATVPSVGKCPQRSHLLSRLTRSRPLRGSANDQGRGRPCPNTILTLHRWPVAGHGTLSQSRAEAPTENCGFGFTR